MRRRSRPAENPLIAALIVLLLSLSLAPPVSAQSTPTSSVPAPTCESTDAIHESGDNDQPPGQQTLTSAACLEGTFSGQESDFYAWDLTEADAQGRWTIQLDGPAAQSLVVAVYLVTFADDGVAVQSATELVKTTVLAGPGQVLVEDLLWRPGRLFVGVASTGPGDYRLITRPGAELPDTLDTEPNDQADAASAVNGNFAISGDRAESEDAVNWTLDEEQAGHSYQLFFQTFVGDSGYLTIADATGSSLADWQIDKLGQISAVNINLPAGTYTILVPADSPGHTPYVLELRDAGEHAADSESEPNETQPLGTLIVPTADSTVINGSLATMTGLVGDIDAYRLRIDDAYADRLVQIKLFWRNGWSRDLCLLDAEGRQMSCMRGDKSAVLRDLLLPAGEYGLTIQGDAAPDDAYLLRVDFTSSLPAEYEHEPNDDFQSASTMDPVGDELQGTGSLTPSDVDFFRASITGEPQLWQLVAEGEGFNRMEALDASGAQIGYADRDPVTNQAQITNLLLRPGDHWFKISGDAEAYSLRLIPLGPPPPNLENEPNNTVDGAQRIRMGEERNGQLIDLIDEDIYRFSLLAPEHVTLQLEPPDDGSFNMAVSWGATELVRLGGIEEPGTPLVYDALLQPGDYLVTLDAGTASSGFYRFTLNQADPFDLPADLEPNDASAEASPLQINQSIEGIASPSASRDDADWYVLPAQPDARTLSIDIESDPDTFFRIDVLAMRSDEAPETELTLTKNEDGSPGGTVELPANQPFAIGLSGYGAYRLTVSDADAPAYQPPGALPATVALTLPDTPIAAYWADAQQLEATVSLANTGAASLELTLDARISDYRWSAAFESDQLTLAAGESRTVPVLITVGPDAWADSPVQITVRAQDRDGRFATGAAKVSPDREAPPLDPQTGWTLTPALRGGLNVAWSGFGATPVQPDQRTYEYEAMLYDGISAHVGGWWDYRTKAAESPIEITVDLAGDAPVPVAGVILNPFGDTGDPAAGLRRFEVQLSNDGEAFTTVLSGELSALPVDQAFVLDAPVEARFARLRVFSNQLSSGPDQIVIGEWKVVAAPDWQFPDAPDAIAPLPFPDAVPTETAAPVTIPEGTGFEISLPERGGHVVFTDPQLGSMESAEAVLQPGGGEETQIKSDANLSWVVGFQHNRAAEISAIAWNGPDEFNPSRIAIGSVEISVSTESPTGPWQSLGTWELASGDADLEIALDEPTWARYVRFTAVPTVPAEVEDGSFIITYLPAATRIFERPMDDTYRSILGEWGEDSPLSIYEQLMPVVAPTLDSDAGNSAETATNLPLDQTRNDSVQTERDEDWYEIHVPADASILEFTLTGEPTVDVQVSLFDQDGAEIPLENDAGQQQRTYSATVTPGGTYRLRVIKPPTALVVAFDMSGSMGAYLDMIFNGVGVYSEAVVPGLEVVNFLPFGESPLLPEMSGDSTALQTAITNYPRSASSSDSESTLLDALGALQGQPGTPAILLLTDAESGSYDATTKLWAGLGEVRPRIFTVQIGAGNDIASQQDLMQDWADSNQGNYHYVYAQGDVDVAFDRTATILRRPSLYSVSVAAIVVPPTPTPSPTVTPSPTATPEPTNTPEPTATATPTVPPEPGSIRVVPAKNQSAGQAPIAGDVSVALILDTSGSMLQPLDASTRAAVAKAALTDLVTTTLPPGTNVSLRSFGNTPDSCDTRLIVPRGPLDPVAMTAQIDALEIVNLVRTPIGASLEAVADDLGDDPGPKIVVLVTDGEETCGGDAEAAIRALVAQGIDVHVNIVGFALDDEALRDQFKQWARLGNGQYIDAANSAELSAAITKVVQPLYRVIDANGKVITTGQVGGPSKRVPAGTYTVEVLTDPVQRYEDVVVKPGKRTSVRMKAARTEIQPVYSGYARRAGLVQPN